MKALFLGLGGRGNHYINFALQEGVEVAGLCDIDLARLNYIAQTYGLESVPQYSDAEEALAQCHDAEICIIALPDPFHYENTLKALKKGMHVLLEKPMALTPQECIEMVQTSVAENRHLVLCHVMRYAPLFEKARELVENGILGKIMNFQLTENVAWWHYAHSYVRGIFSNTAKSAPFLLAKSCHDLDMISYIMNQPCVSVMAEGGLFHFREENAPEGAPKRCLDGCPHEHSCPYFAPAFYLNQFTAVGWPSNRIAEDISYNARLQALQNTDFGLCVYHANNNVRDHISCLFVMEDGASATFNLSGLASENTRTFRIFGTKGDLTGHLDKHELILGDYLTKERKAVEFDVVSSVMSGHGGGDQRLFRDFIELVRDGKSQSKTEASFSLESHLMAFAAEKSMETGKRIYIADFLKEVRQSK